MPRKKQEPTLAQEANLPESWHPIDAPAINPSAPPGAQPAPNKMPPFFDGTISLQMQHPGVFEGTRYGGSNIPVLPLMPMGASGIPTQVAAIKSVVSQISTSTTTTVTGSGNMTFRGQWNSITSYAVDDVVLDNISTYIATTPNTGSEPDMASPNWALLGKNLNFRGQWLPGSSPATVAYVQSSRLTSGTGPTSQAFTSPNTAGNTIIVFVAAGHSFASGHPDPLYDFIITDTQGNTYTKVSSASASNFANGWADTAVYLAGNCKPGSNTVTMTVVGGSPSPEQTTLLEIMEYTGSPAVSPLVSISSAVQSYPPFVTDMTVNVSTTQPNQVVILLSDTNFTSGAENPPAGFATRQVSFYDKIIPAVTSAGYTLVYTGTASGGLVYGLSLTNVGGASYVPYDTVIYRGSTYVCIKASTGAQAPTNALYWYLLSQGTGGVNTISVNYTVVPGDDGQLISNETGSNLTATLFSAPPYLGWWAAFQNGSSGTLVINPNGLTLDGSASSLTLQANQGVLIFTDGTNYFSVRGTGVSSLNSETGAVNIVAGNGITVTPVGQNITIAAIPSGPVSSWVQTKLGTTGGGTSTTVTAAYTTPNVAGNLLIAEVRNFVGGGPTTTITDSNGNTWIQAPGAWADGSANISFWYAPNCKAGANTVTDTCSSSGFLRFEVSEYNTVCQVYDQNIHANGTSTSFNSGSITTSVTTCLFGFIQNETSNATYSGVTGFTVRDASEGNLAVYDQLDASSGTYSFAGTINTSVAWAATLYTFKAFASPSRIASGTATLGTSPISATSSASVVTVAAGAVIATDSIEWSFNAAPGVGYVSGLFIQPYVTPGNVNFLVTNPTAGSLTPAAATLNWDVIR
jgi:hypothetical protein